MSFAWILGLHSWSVEKHRVKRYAYLRVRKLHVALYQRVALCRSWLMGPCLLATPCSWWRIIVQSELPRLSVPLYVIVCVTIGPLSPPKSYVWYDY